MATPQFAQKYKSNIEGLAKRNNVDVGVAEDMLKANLGGKAAYQGGGELDFNVAKADLDNEMNALKTAVPTAAATPQAPKAPSYADEMNSRITDMFQKRQVSEIARIKAEQDKSTRLLNQQKVQLKPQYQNIRNQTDVGNVAAAQKLREAMASQGLGVSGDNNTEMTNLRIARENAQNGTNLQEQSALNDIDRRIDDVNDPSQMQSLISNLEAAKAQMQLDAFRQGKEYDYREGRDTQQDAFNLAGLTGSYVDPKAVSAIQAILDAKRNNQYGGNQTAADAANNARALLPMYNIDPNLFGSDVTYDQAVNNFKKIGTPTLAGKQIDFQQNVQFPWEQSVTKQELEMKGQELAHNIGFDWAQLSQRDKEYLGGLAIQQQNANTSAGNLDLNREEFEYKKTTTGKDVDVKSSAANYADLVGEIEGNSKSYEDARKYIDANIDNLSDADYRRAIDYITKKYRPGGPK